MDRKITLKQAFQNIWKRMNMLPTKEGKAEAERDLQTLVELAKEERTSEILARLRNFQSNHNPTAEAPLVTSKADPKEDCVDCMAVLTHFNTMTGMKCLLVGATKGHIHQRHTLYGVEKCHAVVAFKYNQWKDSTETRKNIDLLTIFRPTNFDRYYNQMNFSAQADQEQPKLPTGDLE